ncbi:hypothetical protein ACFFRR_001780, partial [Megaselia abdita]
INGVIGAASASGSNPVSNSGVGVGSAGASGMASGGVYSGSNTAIGTGSPSNRRIVMMGGNNSSACGLSSGIMVSSGGGGVSGGGLSPCSSSTHILTQQLQQNQQLHQLQQQQLQQTTPGSDSLVRRSRSQGGKKLQKCLSTASYGEELSISRPQFAPMPHSLLMTRQYCSFGSTTSEH